MPTLVVVRHAKADSPVGLQDIARPLAERGKVDARQAGRWLGEHVGGCDLLLVSPARRTEETTARLLDGWGAAPVVVDEERLYEATLGDLLRVVRGLDTETADATVVLVAHNPGVSALVEALTGEVVQLRTAGIAVLDVSGAWADADTTSCTLRLQHTARAETTGPGGAGETSGGH
ncbi:histidine phosphatase family protein [Kineococcus sp. TBRC 1896]|uniref:Histidine phosphatase family protein n=1 Tax=Kineococcus mangrovi TaxID=1660183 RepID=A0ABV4I4L1_9ACTN